MTPPVRPARSTRRWQGVLLAVGLAAASLAGAATPAAAAAPGDPGPIGDRFAVSGQFVDEMYRTILGRGADAAGLAFWRAELDAGVSPAVLAAQFVTSAEFDGTVAPVTRLYDAVLGRLPDRDGLRFWLDARRSGTSLEDVADAFVDSPEFRAIADDDPTVLIDRLYLRVLDRPADAEGRAFWVEELASGRRTIGQVVLGFTESSEFRAATAARTQVVTGYLALLDRAPDDAGLAFWSAEIDAGLDLAALTGHLLASTEYREARPSAPSIERTQVADGFVIPWDVIDVGDGHLLVSQRGGGFVVIEPDGATGAVAADLDDLWVSGETGLMGLAARPGPNGTVEVFSCQGHSSPREIQVVGWSLDLDTVTMTRTADPLVGGLPIVTGRHGGCQLAVDTDGSLFVGTGDAATGTLPQRTDSLGGKVLRVDADTGAGVAGNPFLGVDGDDRIFTLGHRNVQGLALHPQTGEMWSVEHGPDTDDEVNRLRAGGNAGWNPVPGYNEAVPMTDLSLPDVMPAAWSSGRPTLAVSGGTFLDDDRWGAFDGALAIASLKNQTLRLLFFDDDARFLGDRVLVDGELGRLRAVSVAANGDLLVTTSTGSDAVWRLSPTS